jgi:hypothetical protein
LSRGEKAGAIGCLSVIAIIVLAIIGSILSESRKDESRPTSVFNYVTQSVACTSALQSVFQNVSGACSAGNVAQCQDALSQAQAVIDGADSLLQSLHAPSCLAPSDRELKAAFSEEREALTTINSVLNNRNAYWATRQSFSAEEQEALALGNRQMNEALTHIRAATSLIPTKADLQRCAQGEGQ